MKQKIVYITNCPDGNCELTPEKLKRVKLRTGNDYKVCKEHGGRVINRRAVCIDCGEYHYLKERGPGKFRCPPCDTENNRIRSEKNNAKRIDRPVVPKRPPRKVKDYGRGSYCKLIPACIKVKRLPDCIGCMKFQPVYFRVDPGKRGIWPI